MRNKPCLVLSAVATTACVCSVAHAVTLPAGLAARYASLIAALKKVDLKTYDTFYAPEFVSVDPSGKTIHRAEYMAGMQDLAKGVKKMSCQIRYTGIKLHGDSAEVSFNLHGEIFKKEGAYSFLEVGTDTWKKSSGKWMETKTVDKVFKVLAPKPAAAPTTLHR